MEPPTGIGPSYQPRVAIRVDDKSGLLLKQLLSGLGHTLNSVKLTLTMPSVIFNFKNNLVEGGAVAEIGCVSSVKKFK